MTEQRKNQIWVGAFLGAILSLSAAIKSGDYLVAGITIVGGGAGGALAVFLYQLVSRRKPD